LSRDTTADRREHRTLVLALAAFAAIFAARLVDPMAGDAVGILYVFPIAMLAINFGPRVGAAAGALGFGLTLAWVVFTKPDVSPVGYVTRAITLIFVGVVVGHLVRAREEVEHKSARWFEMSNSMLCEASLAGFFTAVNGAWTEVLGHTREELLSRPFESFVHPDDRERTRQATASLAAGPADLMAFENRYEAKDGSWRWLSWTARSDGERIYAVAKDISERKRLEAERHALFARTEVMALTDELTGLPNRRAWDEQLRRELARARRTGAPVSVVVLDLDLFKELNDELGHQAGDEFLRDAAIAWREVLRETDLIARYGGDEFFVLLPETGDAEGITTLVERLREALPKGRGCSAGVATWSGNESAEHLVARADAALYEAKRSGRGRARSAA
jgi:diguanylate cyclase (GGDEF)-like protein/PAS domain S-box-containing protein